MLGEARQTILRMQQEILDAQGRRIWDDYVSALRLISQVVFTRSSGFVLEFLQNAEDAGLGSPCPGFFRVVLGPKKIKITHNGRPFSVEDVSAVCGLCSSKKPEMGTLGYLGIGFKSVFKVTDCPEIHSGVYHFKFDRGQWDKPDRTPWHVLPIPIEDPMGYVEDDRTTFIVPLRDAETATSLLNEVERVSLELYLFLRWLKRIEIIVGPCATLS